MQELDLEEMLNEMTVDEQESQALLNGRLWTPKPNYVQHFPKTLYTDAELVDAFVNTTYAWYTDKTNIMFGWQDEVRLELIRHLKEDDEPKRYDSEPELPHQLIYAEMKFTTEWTGPEGMFIQY